MILYSLEPRNYTIVYVLALFACQQLTRLDSTNAKTQKVAAGSSGVLAGRISFPFKFWKYLLEFLIFIDSSGCFFFFEIHVGVQVSIFTLIFMTESRFVVVRSIKQNLAFIALNLESFNVSVRNFGSVCQKCILCLVFYTHLRDGNFMFPSCNRN